MNSKYILISLLLLFTLTATAKTSYRDMKHGNYVRASHLHYIFNKVKRTSPVSHKALAKAFDYYEKNRYKKHLSPNYIGIADYTKTALEKRLFIVNLHTGEVRSYLLAHGLNSGAKGGRVWRASNMEGSYKTPTGFFKVGYREGITTKKRYDYLGVQGLEWKNRNAKKRQIILHTAPYVGRAGRSHGCFAIEPKSRWAVFTRMKGALLLSYIGN